MQSGNAIISFIISFVPIDVSDRIQLPKGNYSAPMGRIIIAWGNAPGAGVYEVKALKGRIKIKSRWRGRCPGL